MTDDKARAPATRSRSSGLGDDLQRAKVGLCHVLEGATQIEHAATAVAQKIDAIAGHLTEPETLGRVAAAGLGAVLAAAGREMQTAAARPPRPASSSTPPRTLLRCRQHGEQPWQRTIVCTACGRVFQVDHAAAAHFAPEVCPCGAQLLPAPNVARHSATRICTPCFTRIAATGGRAVRRAE
jgi:hypothetical protein